ncbi:MAG: glycogen synthase [Verrucomicrobia bacterium]|nr:glycogen synthase [Verrucomicrobiota bacterium]
MYVVQIASEVAPVAKIGGLADVMMGLSRELKWKGIRVDTVIPKYDCLDTHGLSLECVQKGIRSFFDGEWHDHSLWRGRWSDASSGDLELTFLESHNPKRFFDRGCIYGCHDDIDRFLSFSRAVLQWLMGQETAPDVIHIHDWETAAIAFLIRAEPFRTYFEKTRTVLTIHNIAYQGRCQTMDLDRVGVSGSWYDSPKRLQDDFGSDLNLLKGGIVFSDYVTTVSPTYATEVLTPEGGKGLHLTLNQYSDKFCGILNGIDYSYWNPEIDSHIPFRYSERSKAQSPEDKLLVSEKAKNKETLRKALGLKADSTKPLVVSISRLVQQKGVELIRYAILNAHKKGMQYIVLGTAPDPAIQWEFVTLAHTYAHDPHVRILLQQEESTAHRLYAASDIFLMPSLFEPCGLTQLIALKYGSIPIVRSTGGLCDTVFDVDYSKKPFAETNGFVFNNPDVVGLDSALDRALAFWRQDGEAWQSLMLQAMQYDFSWNTPANHYLNIYQKILSRNSYRYETDSTTEYSERATQ